MFYLSWQILIKIDELFQPQSKLLKQSVCIGRYTIMSDGLFLYKSYIYLKGKVLIQAIPIKISLVATLLRFEPYFSVEYWNVRFSCTQWMQHKASDRSLSMLS